jgi:S1-C subfamily serine protease
MAALFLSKIRVGSADFVDAGGRPVLDRHAELRALLTDRAGPGVAALFAEPLISRGNDAAPPTVSWYTNGEGEGVPLARLSPADRDRAEAWLADHLRPLRALAEDPASADLALGALSVHGDDDILVVDGRPVIVNWGLMPGAMGANAASRPAHYAATLGRYLPLPRLPGAAPVAAPIVAPVAAVAAPRPGPTPLAWVPLLILLLLAGAVLAWLLLPGTRIFPDPVQVAITDSDTLQAQRALNDSLRARRDALQGALDGAICRPDGVLVLPDGATPEGLTPPPVGVAPDRKAQAAPDGLLPNRPDRVLLPDDEAGEVTLLDWIEARTVMVLARSAGGMAVGSGLVVGPGLIVTNQHVIEGAGDGDVLIAARSLARPQPATVLKARGPLADTGTDFALLRIEDDSLPAFALHRPQASLKLAQVIAAGFPGDVLEMDVDFAALRNGDPGAMPELTVTDGIVNTEQKFGPVTQVLMHSAPLSTGNSGGPLIDMCGRVVGVNSFVRKGRLQNRGYALAITDLLAFLDGTPAAPQIIETACAPVVLAPQAAPPADGSGGD